MKKTISAFLIGLSLLVVGLSAPAEASSLSRTSEGQTFERAWRLTATNSAGTASLTYGFNTWAIDEDYSWSTHHTVRHHAWLRNSRGLHSGTSSSANSRSRVDVRHGGGVTITYGMSW
jgi:hypothetical protein